MADPTPYDPSYSFTDFQTNNPTSPLPGVRVDTELENIEASIDSLVAAVKDVRRADGALKSGIVTQDSLTPALQAAVQPGLSIADAQAAATTSAASAAASAGSAASAAASAQIAVDAAGSVTPSEGTNVGVGAGIFKDKAVQTLRFKSMIAPAAGLTVTANANDLTFTLGNDLAALEALSSAGLAVRTATDTWAVRTLAAPAAGFTITNPAGTAGNPTFVLADDLAALEGLATTGYAKRTGASIWTAASIPIADLPVATTAEIRNNIADKLIATDEAWAAIDWVSIASSAAPTPDAALGSRFYTTLNQNATLGAMTNVKNGQGGVIRILQDATGGRTLAFNSVYVFAGGTKFAIDTAANRVSYLSFVVFSPSEILITGAAGVR